MYRISTPPIELTKFHTIPTCRKITDVHYKWNLSLSETAGITKYLAIVIVEYIHSFLIRQLNLVTIHRLTFKIKLAGIKESAKNRYASQNQIIVGTYIYICTKHKYIVTSDHFLGLLKLCKRNTFIIPCEGSIL